MSFRMCKKIQKVKTDKGTLIRYIIISTLCGYSVSIAIASVYVLVQQLMEMMF